MSEKRHPGITMHKISFGGGFIGLLFAAGSALIFVLGFPTLWYFVALATALGLAIALVLHVVHSRNADSGKPLSILNTTENSDMAEDKTKYKFGLHKLPKLASA